MPGEGEKKVGVRGGCPRALLEGELRASECREEEEREEDSDMLEEQEEERLREGEEEGSAGGGEGERREEEELARGAGMRGDMLGVKGVMTVSLRSVGRLAVCINEL